MNNSLKGILSYSQESNSNFFGPHIFCDCSKISLDYSVTAFPSAHVGKKPCSLREKKEIRFFGGSIKWTVISGESYISHC